jgi:ribose/xylose/arabinose/galactoside ABC-type transport system permease subunit
MEIKLAQNNVTTIVSKFGVYLAFAALFIVLSFASPVFLTPNNLINVVRQISVIGIISVGMTFVISTGGIDLSVGATVAMSAVAASSFAVKTSTAPLIVPLLIGLLVGAAMGALSGFFVAKMNVAPFIATLAMMTIGRGFAMVYTDGRPVVGLSEAYIFIGKGSVGGIPVPVIIFAVVVILGIFLFHFTKFGRHVLAVGGNEMSARVSGINVDKTKFFVYFISGVLSAVAAIVLSARIQTGQPAGGDGYELDAITAVVIGGTSLSGGVGTIVGSLIGMLIIGIMTNGLDLLNVSSYYQKVIKGVIILLEVTMDRKKIA